MTDEDPNSGKKNCPINDKSRSVFSTESILKDYPEDHPERIKYEALQKN